MIERAGVADWERVRATRLRALADTPDAFGRTLAEDQALTRDDWIRRLQNESNATFVAIVDGSDVGMAVGGPYSDDDLPDGEKPTAGLFGMWVAPEARGRGVGSELIEAVVAWARSKSYSRIALDVGNENAFAIALYTKNGFVPSGLKGTLPPPRECVLEHQMLLNL